MTGVRRLTYPELLALLERGESPTLVDVRERDEFAVGSLEGALNVPLTELSAFLSGREPDEAFVFICEVGERSLQAATFAATVGYANVSSLDGGIVTARAR